MKKFNGFTLIELLVTIAIVGIIVAVALPSYKGSIQKSRRADALVALTEQAMNQERYYTLNNKFSSAAISSTTSDEGYYTISGDFSDCTDSCFILSATPVTTESQASDETCWTITISHTGKKSSKNKSGVANASKTCW
ncbi:prepilin-type N-terminal cleavage/methylation domain-containing protein [Psychromonas sp.]|nr:prepilin-type N-terminal cleavage/methylation domain-containing protein [Psychromonas sp.]